MFTRARLRKVYEARRQLLDELVNELHFETKYRLPAHVLFLLKHSVCKFRSSLSVLELCHLLADYQRLARWCHEDMPRELHFRLIIESVYSNRKIPTENDMLGMIMEWRTRPSTRLSGVFNLHLMQSTKCDKVGEVCALCQKSVLPGSSVFVLPCCKGHFHSIGSECLEYNKTVKHWLKKNKKCFLCRRVVQFFSVNNDITKARRE